MKHPLRFSDGLDSKNNKISIVCNDLKIGAEEISDLYRSRWQIELFIKWIKQHLVIKKLYGTSQNAVFNQIYLAMITFCLTLLMKNDLKYQGTLLEMMHWITDFCADKIKTFLYLYFMDPNWLTTGRRIIKHQCIFIV